MSCIDPPIPATKVVWDGWGHCRRNQPPVAGGLCPPGTNPITGGSVFPPVWFCEVCLENGRSLFFVFIPAQKTKTILAIPDSHSRG